MGPSRTPFARTGPAAPRPPLSQTSRTPFARTGPAAPRLAPLSQTSRKRTPPADQKGFAAPSSLKRARRSGKSSPAASPLRRPAADVWLREGAALDVYEGKLREFRPPSGPGEATPPLTLYAAPLAALAGPRRLEIEELLHAAWLSDQTPGKDPGFRSTVSRLLALRDSNDEPMKLRSGKSLSRVLESKPGPVDAWAIWEEKEEEEQEERRHGSGLGRVVGALVLHHQNPTNQEGGMVMEYIAAHRARGGKGYPMVLAAEAICRREGVELLYSGCDLSRGGRAFGAKTTTAFGAHRTWGFQRMEKKEWNDLGLELYTGHCDICYMRKAVPRLPTE